MTAEAIRTIGVRDLDRAAKRSALAREFLVSNGLGGYSSGTIGGVPARRYHALLVAGLPPPFGRRVLLVDFVAEVTLPSGGRVSLCDEDGGLLCDFRLEDGLPVWRYEHAAFALEKRIVMPHAQNTVHVIYQLLRGGARLALDFAVVVHNRPHDAPVNTQLPGSFVLGPPSGVTRSRCSTCRSCVFGCSVARPGSRSVAATCPRSRTDGRRRAATSRVARRFAIGQAFAVVAGDAPVVLIASAEPWDVITALEPSAALEAEHERRMRLVGGRSTRRERASAPSSFWPRINSSSSPCRGRSRIPPVALGRPGLCPSHPASPASTGCACSSLEHKSECRY